MAMSRNDYEALAAIIRTNLSKYEPGYAKHDVIVDVATDMAKYFEQSNPSFDAVRFIKACETTKWH